MFQLEPHGDYFDVIERTLYNNLAAGVSLSGDRYFYACPLESDGKYQFNLGWLPSSGKDLPHAERSATRKEWFPCACCPPTLARYLPQVPGFAYATRGDDVFVNLFIAGEAKVRVGNRELTLKQEGDYAWSGKAKLTIASERGLQPASVSAAGSAVKRPEGRAPFALNVRIPGWARGEPTPGGLYRFSDFANEVPSLRMNGEAERIDLTNGYARLTREWKSGDTVELTLPMNVQRITARDEVKANRARVALQRGPILYCFEGADNGGRVLDLALPAELDFKPRAHRDLLGGTTTLEGTALRDGKRVSVTAIPYHLWSNRGVGEMAVWMRAAQRLP